MSLFRAREWWSARSEGEGEEVSGSLLIANVDNSPEEEDKLVVGGLSGVLRIYRPAGRGYKPADLMLEAQLGAPILQVEAGRFSQHSPKEIALAVLFPKALAVFCVSTTVVQGEATDDSFINLSLLYKHELKRSAFNFTYGSFGGTKDKDIIAVQSLDGELLFIEHEQVTFSKFLPNFLVPGPMCYLPQPFDAIVTVNSQFECQCFKYSTLSSSSGGNIASEDDREKENRRARTEWTTCLGESAIQVQCFKPPGYLTSEKYEIVILGERSAFWLTGSGSIRASKEMEQPITCMYSYVVQAQEKAVNFLFGTISGQLLVYNYDLKLLWAALLDFPPISVGILSAGGVRGLVGTLGENGDVMLSYMGTEPPSQNIQVTVKLFVSYTGQDSLENIKLTVKVPEPFTCNIENKEIPFLEGGSGTPRTISLVFGVSSPSLPTGTEVSVVAAYQSKSGDPRIVSSSFALPLALCGRGIPPVKDGAYKITLDINQEPPSLLALFEDIPFQGGSTLPNVFSFLYHDGTQTTIIVAKNTNRFRIQSAAFASLALLSSELARRLKLHFANAEDEFMIGFNDDLGEQLNIYSTVIDSHFDARKALKSLHDELEIFAKEFRTIQKRLLVRYKDRNASSLMGMDKLLSMSYDRIVSCAEKGEKMQQELKSRANQLSNATRLMLLLLRFKFQLDDDGFNILEDHWSPRVVDCETQYGWEEATELSLGLLLKTALSKSGQREATLPQEPPKAAGDTSKLKKLMVQVCERLAAQQA
ncbi:hypothetical protein GUITHDRAFT_109345 [Guillardia theta CCMP2712]|uniref:Protein PTHB1 n=1 Tax=Guillardia theta (strain CCMP2712) TaxID=905079 RepID=L1J7Q0_GUITC|nr:hypothetical protein GUITHDRAFT_109345 [Guillardia theta CCMP2712]EKX44568.1 hypothetical protein GUITHDRAFT_109345 [Guillardia theta CCMP2712]|eukprot:XP_005831548.1 hypothetical protein GUITHDRAFT_109345 [Guillardia theta CCMP2712]